MKRKTNEIGYVDVNERSLANGNVVYYAKTRLDLNDSKQTKVGKKYDTARECAINLATYLKEHPPTALDPDRKVPPVHPKAKAFCLPLH